MQMLNFVKISTMLLLLQLISTNNQHNNPYTVVRINVKSIRLNNKANIDGNSRPVYQYDNAGEIKEQISYCEAFMQWPKDLLPLNPQATRCTDNHFEPIYNYFPQFGLIGYSELKFIYRVIEEVDINKLSGAMVNKIKNKKDTLQIDRNLINITNFNVSVETITPDVPTSKPTSTPVTNGKTVLRIRIKVIGTRKSSQKNNKEYKIFESFMQQAEKMKYNYVCEVFTIETLPDIPKYFVSVDCRNVSITPFMNKRIDVVILAESELIYTYNNTVTVDKRKIIEGMRKRARYYEYQLKYYFIVKVSVETITPDVPTSKPTSTPVTNGKTVVTIFVKTLSFRAKDEKGDVHRGEFLAKSLSDRYYLTDEFCDVFMPVAQMSVPVNWGEYTCKDVSSKIVETRADYLILQKMSKLLFIYMNEENLDKANLASNLVQIYRDGYLNNECSLNDIDGMEFEVAVQHYV